MNDKAGSVLDRKAQKSHWISLVPGMSTDPVPIEPYASLAGKRP